MSTADLATRFVDALGGPDVGRLRSLLAPDARFWINIGPADLTADQRLALLEVERAHLATLAFDDVRTQPTPGGFVVQLTTAATTAGGLDLRIPVCLVVEVDDGAITRVEEYADSAPAAPLLRAMSKGR